MLFERTMTAPPIVTRHLPRQVGYGAVRTYLSNRTPRSSGRFTLDWMKPLPVLVRPRALGGLPGVRLPRDMRDARAPGRKRARRPWGMGDVRSPCRGGSRDRGMRAKAIGLLCAKRGQGPMREP